MDLYKFLTSLGFTVTILLTQYINVWIHTTSNFTILSKSSFNVLLNANETVVHVLCWHSRAILMWCIIFLMQSIVLNSSDYLRIYFVQYTRYIPIWLSAFEDYLNFSMNRISCSTISNLPALIPTCQYVIIGSYCVCQLKIVVTFLKLGNH